MFLLYLLTVFKIDDKKQNQRLYFYDPTNKNNAKQYKLIEKENGLKN